MLATHQETNTMIQTTPKNLAQVGQTAARRFGNELVDSGMTEKDIIRVAGFLIDYVREKIESPNNGKLHA